MTNFKHQEPVQYAALSHRWGSPATVDFAATTCDNLHVFQDANGIEDGALPKTFQDAITVTRKLKIPYLWIDSLCILQKTGKGDDREHKEDWERESLLMEKVFSSAYLTIAASCAEHRFDGFLKKRQQRDFVTMTASDGAHFHVCQVIDDFDNDVEQGELNKRGWVLQERALSCRTIHFTETQTYWECGKGIKCETFTKTENRKAAFLGDSNFPHSVEAFKHGRQIQHYQGLYERYSSLGLSNQEDRPVAIAGLEQRLMTALKSTGGYGIFQSNFHRDLLWHRQHGRPTLERIKFGKSVQVPSWSWMAFGGEIRYMNAPLGGVEWNRKVISPFKVPNEGNSSFGAQHPIEFQAPVRRLKGERPKLLLQDEPCRELDSPLKCVVIGSNKDGSAKSRQHYAIILSSIRKNGSHQFYERVGVAYLTEEELSNVENEQETEVGTIR